MEFRLFNRNRYVDADAFHAGTQAVSGTPLLDEIEHGFAHRKEALCEKTAPAIGALEAQLDDTHTKLRDHEPVWRNFEAATGGVAPQFALAGLAVLTVLIALAAEGVFLAPVLDGFGIADQMQQLLLAPVLVITAGGLLKVMLHRLHRIGGGEQAGSFMSLVMTSVLTLLSWAFVVVLGWWRAEELIYGGAKRGGALGGFLTENRELTIALSILLTIGLPLFSAAVFEWALHGLHQAWQWRRARSVFQRLTKRRVQAEKKLGIVQSQLEKGLARLDEQCAEQSRLSAHHFALGERIGAVRMPVWTLIFRCVLAVFAACVLCLLADVWLVRLWVPFWLFAALNLAGGFCLSGWLIWREIKAWLRPAPNQLLAQRAVIWRKDEWQPLMLSQGEHVALQHHSAAASAAAGLNGSNGQSVGPRF